MRTGRGVDHPPSSNIEVKERIALYIYSPSRLSWQVLGDLNDLSEIQIYSLKFSRQHKPCSLLNDTVTIMFTRVTFFNHVKRRVKYTQPVVRERLADFKS